MKKVWEALAGLFDRIVCVEQQARRIPEPFQELPARAGRDRSGGDAYQEGDDLVYSVPIPAELYRWLEAYVIEHYAPVKRIKRKRKDWKAGE